MFEEESGSTGQLWLVGTRTEQVEAMVVLHTVWEVDGGGESQ